jgi:tetratricopeptide (TPR) repeat protein
MDKRMAKGWNKAIRSFRQAIDQDPACALAHAGMSESYTLLGYWAYMSANEAFPNALALAKQAIALDDGLAEAHTALGLASLVTWDWKNAKQELHHAIALNPTLVSSHMYLSWYLAALGKLSAAIEQGEIAKGLDPHSAYVSTSVDTLYMLSGEYTKALELAKKALEITPHAAVLYYDLFTSYAAQGNHDMAAECLANGLVLEGREQEAGQIMDSYNLGGFKAMLRKRIEIDRHETDGKYDPYQVAVSYAQLGDKDRALQWLNRAYEVRSGVLFVKVDDHWNQLRADTRYVDLLRRMGLLQEGLYYDVKNQSANQKSSRNWTSHNPPTIH